MVQIWAQEESGKHFLPQAHLSGQAGTGEGKPRYASTPAWNSQPPRALTPLSIVVYFLTEARAFTLTLQRRSADKQLKVEAAQNRVALRTQLEVLLLSQASVWRVWKVGAAAEIPKMMS